MRRVLYFGKASLNSLNITQLILLSCYQIRFCTVITTKKEVGKSRLHGSWERKAILMTFG